MSDIISIIVPIYNIENELRYCLDSILKQTYKNWICLLIDDGSTDRSGEICDLYAKKDTRFRVYHNKNKGVGETRNFGIKESSSEYITFIDGDDWVDNNYLKFLIEKMTPDLDMVMCHALFEYPNKSVEVLKMYPNIIECNEENKIDYILSSITKAYAKNNLKQEHGFLNTLWGKLYRLSVIKNNDIKMNKLKLNEDAVFNIEFFYYARKFKLYNNKLYHYRMRENSAVHSFKKDYIEMYSDYLRAIKQYIEKYYSFSGRFSEAYYSLALTSVFNIMKDYFYNPKYPLSYERTKYIKQLIHSEPYDKITALDNRQVKNKEIILIQSFLKYKLFFLMRIYFGIRPNLKKAFIIMKGNNSE